MNEPVFICPCKSDKTHELLMDGGIFGLYKLKICIKCYFKQDKKFVVKETVENGT